MRHQHQICLALGVLLGAASALAAPQSLLPEESSAADAAVLRGLSRRRYGGELKRDVKLWAEMAKRAQPAPHGAATLESIPDTELRSRFDGPTNFTWANHNGIDFLVPQRNQHIPYYCGSCWAFAATSTLADRWNVRQHQIDPNTAFVPIQLSVQAILSCGNKHNECGTCEGGDDAKVYELAHDKGLVHQSCSEYMARDTICSEFHIGPSAEDPKIEERPECYNCDEKQRCWHIPKQKRLWTTQAMPVSTEKDIMHEIYHNGPVACAIMATDKMEHEYGENCMQPPDKDSGAGKPGTNCITTTFQENQPDGDARINHVVEVVGWGTDNVGNKFWTVRNSWGENWGMRGFMNIVRDSNAGPLGQGNNLLESQCSYARVKSYGYSKDSA